MHLPKEKVIEIVKDTVETLGYTAVETRLVTSASKKELKVVIYDPGKSISMQDCTSVSNVLLRRLEIDDPSFSEMFDMIVESPGVDRKIDKPEEALLFKDKEIRFVLRNPAAYGMKDNVLIGMVQSFENGVLKIDSSAKIFDVPWSDISSAKLYFDIKKYL